MPGPPAFDPSKPFSVLGAPSAPSAPTFDPSKPFKMVGDEPEPKKAPSWLDSLGTFLEHGTRSVQAKTVWDSIQALNPFVVDDADPNYVGSPAYGPLTGTTAMGVSKALDRSRPLRTLRHVVEAQAQLAQKAEDDFKAGRYGEGVVKAIHALVPVFGPGLQSAGEDLSKGEYARGLGKTLDMAGQVVAPKAFGAAAEGLNAAGLRVTPRINSLNPAEAEAVASLRAGGVPIDAATATGNSFVKGAKIGAEKGSLAGSIIGDRASAAQARGLATLGDQLAAKGYPTAVTKEAAGLDLEKALKVSATGEGAQATTHYDALRAIEADPKNMRRVVVGERTEASGVLDASGNPVVRKVPVIKDVPLGVDVASSRPGIKPIYDRLAREAELTPGSMMGDKARALNALDRIMKADDWMPLSAVDDALSSLKQFVREGSNPEFPSEGRAAISQAVKELDGSVQRAAAQAGPKAVKALKEGRLATVRKYEVLDVLDELNKEPVKTINALTAAKGANLGKLRRVAAMAPDEMPKVGRAWLDEQIATATAEDGFAHTDKIYAEWKKLDPQTKQLIYRDPGYVKDLDNFFLGAKKWGENVNPSGTARAVMAGAHGMNALTSVVRGNLMELGAAAAYEVTGGALAKILHSRRGVQLLTQGMRLQVSPTLASGAAGAKVAADLARFAGPEWYRSPVFAGQDQNQP